MTDALSNPRAVARDIFMKEAIQVKAVIEPRIGKSRWSPSLPSGNQAPASVSYNGQHEKVILDCGCTGCRAAGLRRVLVVESALGGRRRAVPQREDRTRLAAGHGVCQWCGQSGDAGFSGHPGVGPDQGLAGGLQFGSEGGSADCRDRSGNVSVPGPFGTGRCGCGARHGADGAGQFCCQSRRCLTRSGGPDRGAAGSGSQADAGRKAVHHPERGRQGARPGQHHHRSPEVSPGAGGRDRGPNQECASQRGAARSFTGAGAHRPGTHADYLAGQWHRDQARD